MASHDRTTLRQYLVLVLVCNLGCAAAAFAQNGFEEVHISPAASLIVPRDEQGQANPVFDTDIKPIRKNVDLVMVPVTITDERDRIIVGLTQSNFQVFDGKEQQEIKHFSSEDTPVSVGIVLDMSGSMAKKVEWARQAVMEFCSAANPLDEFFLVTFANQPELAADFTTRAEDIQSRMVFGTVKGRTALLDAISLALNQMRRAQYQKRALLIISDGGDNHSRYTETEVTAMVKEADVSIYGIGIYDPSSKVPEEMYGPILLEEITRLTGGRAFAIERPNLLPALAAKIGAELRHQYLLAYRPENATNNGKWRKIKVKLRVPKALWPLWVHAKSGYYAPSK